jgi:hypothetical protein
VLTLSGICGKGRISVDGEVLTRAKLLNDKEQGSISCDED